MTLGSLTLPYAFSVRILGPLSEGAGFLRSKKTGGVSLVLGLSSVAISADHHFFGKSQNLPKKYAPFLNYRISCLTVKQCTAKIKLVYLSEKYGFKEEMR